MSDSKQWDVISAGDTFIDLVMTGFAALPGLGEEGFAAACERETGGGAAHTSAGLARLGMKTALYGVAGAVEIDWFRRTFAERGVDAAMVVEHPDQPSGITVAVSTPQDRIFYTYYGANVLLAELLTLPSTWELFASGKHVHFAYPVASLVLTEIAEFLHARGTSVSIDVGWQEAWLWDAASVAAIASVDWFMPNEREAERMTGESQPRRMMEWFRDHGARGIALKLGPEGSATLLQREIRIVPSIPVHPIDTTGAGDCFNAGFLQGVLSGMTLEDSLRQGNICGALSTEASGGIAGFPSMERVREMMTG